ncbi:penicillin-binding protein activator [Acinetobacter sp. ANC 4648]|uniref:penicillin-binding protein activator n=1 Tax=Acinetobacter sp. ANC 4648 TaxID=1977875 RepID=UPI000A32CFE4|nr:penicillin-binding protein activator [Acinetobacter sp. ANC 4648]OTG81710.1 hypothetical protein B9T27_10615 [Acinetobacter sp. ANC 4648]
MIKKIKLSGNKKWLSLGLLSLMMNVQAEVLVILPESGPMARAGLSIKQGIMSAYQSSSAKIPLKFVNSDQKSIKSILKQNVGKKTTMIIGPLARGDVEALIHENPKIPVLALNEVTIQHKNVWQYSLSKEDDSLALINKLEKDAIDTVYILRQSGTETDSLSFVNALHQKYAAQIEPIDVMPNKIGKNQGLLLLGNNQWLNSLKKLPKQHIYTAAFAVEDSQPLPLGIKFCDVPAVYSAKWDDVIQAYKKNPTSMPYQRLLAFGGDAWHIAEQFVMYPQVKNLSFSGRTGQIKILSQRVERTPQCFEKTSKGLDFL